MTAIYMGHL